MCILAAAKCSRCRCKCRGSPAARGLPRLTVAPAWRDLAAMASVGEQRPMPSETGLISVGLGRYWYLFDLLIKTESEWGEPGPPTVDQDHQGQLDPCMCTPRRRRCKFFRADPILRTSDTCFSLTEIRPVPWPDPTRGLVGIGAATRLLPRRPVPTRRRLLRRPGRTL